jgi:NADH dehydrogenase FAD-containing subunit
VSDNIVVLGGGYAGVMAAARMARRGVAVTLVDAREGMVERIRLHQVAAGDDIPPIPYRQLLRNVPVNVVRARVTSIDRERKEVATSDGVLPYDKLVYALGSDSPLGNPLRVREQLTSAKSVTVVGGGLTGIELASEVAERHPQLAVTLVDAGTIGDGLSERASRHLREWFARHHVTLVENQHVEQDTDAIWCASFTLSPIAREAGLRVNDHGQILVDAHLRSSDPSIYAVGDAAFVPGRRMSCALALPMGAYLADLLCGATTKPFRMGFAIQCISLGRNDGIVQFVTPDAAPRDSALLGRPAAWIKELICRYTIVSLRMETRGIHYHWPQPEELAA